MKKMLKLLILVLQEKSDQNLHLQTTSQQDGTEVLKFF